MLEYFNEEADNLSILTDKQRLEYVIQKGQQVDGLPGDEQIPANKVEGCQSNAYLKVQTGDTVTVKTAADSKVVRGYLAFLSEGLTGHNQGRIHDEAKASVEHLVNKGDLSSTFTPNRSDAFTNVLDAILQRLKVDDE